MKSENKSPVTKRKAPRSAFKPGQSGNPGGRPKALVEVTTLARAHTLEAIAALARIANSVDAPPAASVAASVALLDRAWGRPVQTQQNQQLDKDGNPADPPASIVAIDLKAALAGWKPPEK